MKNAWLRAGTGSAIVASLLLLPGCFATSGTTVSGGAVYRTDHTQVAVVFSDHDRDVISNYYHHRHSNLPPGLAKKQHLPPGLQKQVARNGHLPPGLEGERLPYDLEQQLQRLPDDYVRLRVGADIALMNGRTRVVVDVIKDIAI